jgi:hypothetical protein
MPSTCTHYATSLSSLVFINEFSTHVFPSSYNHHRSYGFVRKRTYSHVMTRLLSWNLSILNFVYFSVTNSTLNIFNCLYSGADLVMLKEPSLKCSLDDPTYYRLFVFGIFCIVIYVVGIPLLFSSLLLMNRRDIMYDVNEEDNDMKDRRHRRHSSGSFGSGSIAEMASDIGLKRQRVRLAYGFLYEAYKPGYFYWKIIEIFRKVRLTSFFFLTF